MKTGSYIYRVFQAKFPLQAKECHSYRVSADDNVQQIEVLGRTANYLFTYLGPNDWRLTSVTTPVNIQL